MTAIMRRWRHRRHANRVWGRGNWTRHVGCPGAVMAGQTVAYHHVAYHGDNGSSGDQTT